MWGENMNNESNDELKDLTLLTTLNGENIIYILASYNGDYNDYIWCWKQRISEEIRTRIATGIVTPVRVLTWCVRGIGWETLNKEVPL